MGDWGEGDALAGSVDPFVDTAGGGDVVVAVGVATGRLLAGAGAPRAVVNGRL